MAKGSVQLKGRSDKSRCQAVCLTPFCAFKISSSFVKLENQWRINKHVEHTCSTSSFNFSEWGNKTDLDRDEDDDDDDDDDDDKDCVDEEAGADGAVAVEEINDAFIGYSAPQLSIVLSNSTFFPFTTTTMHRKQKKSYTSYIIKDRITGARTALAEIIGEKSAFKLTSHQYRY